MNNRIISYDILKTLALFAVIIMHIIGNTINTFNLEGNAKIIYNIICNLSYFAVPIFIMVSGSLFLNPNKEIELSTIFKKYILRIVLCLFIFGIIYSGLEIYFNTRVISFSYIYNSISNIFTGHLWAHMWYLYLILSLYLLTPIFKVLTSNISKDVYKYWLIILFIFTILINDFTNYFNTNIAFNIIIDNPYIFLYFLGDYISRYEISRKIVLLNYAFSIISILIIILNNIYNFFSLGYINYTCFLSFNITMSIFVLIKNHKTKLKNKINNFIIEVSKCSLGIYLIHQLIINIIYKLLKIDIILSYPYLCLILYTIVTFYISYFITKLLRKNRFIKKYML